MLTRFHFGFYRIEDLYDINNRRGRIFLINKTKATFLEDFLILIRLNSNIFILIRYTP